MHLLGLLLGTALCLGVMLDAFQTIILPRRPTGRFRLTRLFYLATLTPWHLLADKIANRKRREQMYSVFGPLSVLVLLVFWAAVLTTGFGLIFWGLHSPFTDNSIPPGHRPWAWLRTDLYVSGTSLTTLGPGDVTPHSQIVRALMILESGTGLGFVALVIAYVPVLYSTFSRREVSVALLDARGGSPPTAAELLRRHTFDGGQHELIVLLAEWERWSAELLESHISYPVLCQFRSQHDNQSWLSALVSVIDACALLITTIEGPASRQAQLTFAVARHALVDLGHVLHLDAQVAALTKSGAMLDRRLPREIFLELCDSIADSGVRLCADPAAVRRLTAVRQMYEPAAQALAIALRMPLPQWIAEAAASDQWKKVQSLRADPESVLAGVAHVSERSAAARLQDEDGHAF